MLNHEATYEWGQLVTYLQYSRTIIGRHTNTPNTPLGADPTKPQVPYPVIGSNSGTSIEWDTNWRRNQDIIFQTSYNNAFDFNDWGSLTLNAGLYYIWEELRIVAVDRGENFLKAMNQVALFAEGQYDINEYISTTLGLRYNYSDLFSAIPNPRFYVNVYPTTWLTLKAGVSSGVRVPQMNYLHNGWQYSPNVSATAYTRGNTELKPEQTWNYEITALIDSKYASFDMTGYYTDFSNVIVSVGLPNDAACPAGVKSAANCLTYENANKSLLAGLELGAKLKEIYGFSLNANYNFAYSQVLSVRNANQQALSG
ncbi:TonB-dependent receptor [Helicobacter saguini]|uniref:TonB-dependent receptor n=1 Tax=Helicobacter saguini TaxID=1548018 RepID=A0A6B0HTA0_9HELI|nr:TonB-dependent receptor [Helicobacter saguini]MWV61207.1 TonB-dependent receptor [Helicobacter saguini]MWV68126.1 TonB-dependent receptor [Helicobacter saguini]MWV70410.1 TonB-dependent receptor [Helicobacter saguini]MWV72311.1 TonB-dependent receptor [Helicobacter saguini]